MSELEEFRARFEAERGERQRRGDVPRPDFHTGVHWIQARRAFEPGSDAYPARVREIGAGFVVVERIRDAVRRKIFVTLPARLAEVMARDDLTHDDGAPLALVNEGYRVVALATGPKEAPRRIIINSAISSLEDGAAVEIPTEGDDQPDWQLLAIRMVRKLTAMRDRDVE